MKRKADKIFYYKNMKKKNSPFLAKHEFTTILIKNNIFTHFLFS